MTEVGFMMYKAVGEQFILTRKPSYRKDDRTMHPMYGCPENFRESLTTPMSTFLKILMGYVPIEPINVHAKFEVCSFTRS